MLERAAPFAKLVCGGLGIVLVLQVTQISRRWNPVGRTSVPEVPTWSPPTNTPPAAASSGAPGAPGPGLPPGARPPGRPGRGGTPGGPGPALPPEAQARVDRIVQSELLGMIMRPPPMALLGIVGDDVLLRAPNGMSGLVRAGGELGGVQVLRIGTNRVLVKEDGVEKELTIFDGIGGESLLSPATQGKP